MKTVALIGLLLCLAVSFLVIVKCVTTAIQDCKKGLR